MKQLLAVTVFIQVSILVVKTEETVNFTVSSTLDNIKTLPQLKSVFELERDSKHSSIDPSRATDLLNHAIQSLEAIRELPLLSKHSSPGDLTFDKITGNESYIEAIKEEDVDDGDPMVRKSYGYKVMIYSEPIGDGEKQNVTKRQSVFGDTNSHAPNFGNTPVAENIDGGAQGNSSDVDGLNVAADSIHPEKALPTHLKRVALVKPNVEGHERGAHVTNQDNVHHSEASRGHDRGHHLHEKTSNGHDRGFNKQEHGSHEHVKDHGGHRHDVRGHDIAGLAEEGYRERAEIEYYERERFLDAEQEKSKKSQDYHRGVSEHQAHDEHGSHGHRQSHDDQDGFKKASDLETRHLPEGKYDIVAGNFGKGKTHEEGFRVHHGDRDAHGEAEIHGRKSHQENEGDRAYSDNNQAKRTEKMKERGYKIVTEREFYRKNAHHDKGFGRHDSAVQKHEKANDHFGKEHGHHDRGFTTEVKDHEAHDSAHEGHKEHHEDHLRDFGKHYHGHSKPVPVLPLKPHDQRAYGSSEDNVATVSKLPSQPNSAKGKKDPAYSSTDETYSTVINSDSRPSAHATNGERLLSHNSHYSKNENISSSSPSILNLHTNSYQEDPPKTDYRKEYSQPTLNSNHYENSPHHLIRPNQKEIYPNRPDYDYRFLNPSVKRDSDERYPSPPVRPHFNERYPSPPVRPDSDEKYPNLPLRTGFDERYPNPPVRPDSEDSFTPNNNNKHSVDGEHFRHISNHGYEKRNQEPPPDVRPVDVTYHTSDEYFGHLGEKKQDDKHQETPQNSGPVYVPPPRMYYGNKIRYDVSDEGSLYSPNRDNDNTFPPNSSEYDRVVGSVVSVSNVDRHNNHDDTSHYGRIRPKVVITKGPVPVQNTAPRSDFIPTARRPPFVEYQRPPPFSPQNESRGVRYRVYGVPYYSKPLLLYSGERRQPGIWYTK
ncbi:uncharacterized protein LOC143239048 isoform X2 [Tachypleus tridentatus]|uniref:uncharacterized protein LOC143239048 isoform X2 n=1 Tax=Tachypleus tridentatus TaxID=6853 RepID=UPI003FD2EC25